ncbi:hypothetical protein EZS27_025553 [termite gut metagenome]|uniref:Uncharacterized protein n=1 Tax=termite gut metagenome TaxID=433724 RepID=A0A5J4QUF8_9ZZZZ
MTTDSHDTTQSSQQWNPEKEKEVTETSGEVTEKEAPIEASDKVEQPKRALQLTKEAILKRLNELCADAENTNKQELDSLKLIFYKLHNAELEEDRKQFVETKGTEDGYIPKISDEDEKEFKGLMAVIKEKRNKQSVEIEKQKEENLISKLVVEL